MGLSREEQLILAAIELELQYSRPRLAGHLDAFNARADRQGPQRFASHVSRRELIAVFGVVLVMSALMTLVILCYGR
ncbi:hypothetical protein [Nonomuraea sp. NPDC002799]